MSTLTDGGAGQPRGRFALYVAIFLAALVPLLIPPVLPTVDYYDHVARYYVLSHLDQDAFLAQNYSPRWAILPNIGMDVLGATLARVIPVLPLAKLLVAIIFAVQYFGLLYFNRKLTGRDSLLVALLGIALLYSFIFTWGFANFLLGLGLSLWGAGWWVAHRERPCFAIPTSCVIALVIFLTHGFAFGLYGLLLGGLEIGYFLAARPRSFVTFAQRMGALAAQAVAPALLFRASATVKAKEGVTNADEAVKRLTETGGLWDRIGDLVIHRTTTVVRVSEGPALWFDVATNGLLVGAVVFLLLRRRIGFAPQAWPALAIAAALFAIIPPALFGVGYVGDRIPLLIALVAVAALEVKPTPDFRYRLVLWTVMATVFVKVAAIGWSWIAYREDYAAYRKVVERLPQHSVVAFSNLANTTRLADRPRCEMYGPLLLAYGHATPLFVIPTAQPMELQGDLKQAIDAKPLIGVRPRSDDRSLDRFEGLMAAGKFDYLLACGIDRVLDPQAHRAARVISEGRYTLFRVSGTQ